MPSRTARSCLAGAAPLTALSLALLVSPGASAQAAECIAELDRIGQEHSTTRANLDDSERRNIRTLTQGARILAGQDKEEACDEVAEAVEEILEARREELVEQGVVLEIEEEKRLEELAQAQKLDGQRAALRASEIMGADLRNLRDEEIGSIEDVIIESGGRQLTFILISSGGFLGFGEDLVAVPVEVSRATPDLNTIVLPFTEEQLEEAPKVTGEGLHRLEEADWREQNLAYFQNLPHEGAPEALQPAQQGEAGTAANPPTASVTEGEAQTQ